MVSIAFSRIMELFALWKGEIIMALACRVMIWALLWVANHFKSKKQYTDELILLFYITFVLDTGSAVIARGPFDLYSWATIYTVCLILLYLSNKANLDPFILALLGKAMATATALQQQEQQQEHTDSIV